jgi:DNA replication and repair protein RecF
MLVNKVIIDSYRNIENIEFKLEKNNIIYGLNGSGKTNILDAFYQLSYGKSFHLNQNKYLIKNDKDVFTIFAEINNISNISKIAISKNRNGKKTSKVNGKNISKQSDISLHLPVISIIPESIKSITGSNSDKRAFINLCMFHVEPNFLGLWKKYNVLLKQRNKTIKAKTYNALSIWDQQLNTISDDINKQIKSLIKKIEVKLNYYTYKILEIKGFIIFYDKGWETDIDLFQSLQQNLITDIKYGYTTKGIHRYKINYQLEGVDIKNNFSRAQCKLFTYCLYLSLIDVLNKKETLLLLDDPLSELDLANCDKIFSLLETIDIQKIISTSVLPDKLQKTFKVFHVEHGTLISKI